MSSRFVSAGAINPSTGEVTALPDTAPPNPQTSSTAPNPQPSTTPSTAPPTTTTTTTKKQAEWAAIQSQLDAARLAATTKTSGPEPPSLYDTLQANKAAKQAAHDEATRLRNQFRALDEDEVEFLADVRAAKHAEEERVRRETEEGLKAFREGRGVVGRVEGEGEEEEDGGVGWEVGGGKRRRRDGGGGGGKRRVVGVLGRKGSGGDVKGSGGGDVKEEERGGSGEKKQQEMKTPVVVTESVKKPGGLVDYGSSDDDE